MKKITDFITDKHFVNITGRLTNRPFDFVTIKDQLTMVSFRKEYNSKRTLFHTIFAYSNGRISRELVINPKTYQIILVVEYNYKKTGLEIKIKRMCDMQNKYGTYVIADPDDDYIDLVKKYDINDNLIYDIDYADNEEGLNENKYKYDVNNNCIYENHCDIYYGDDRCYHYEVYNKYVDNKLLASHIVFDMSDNWPTNINHIYKEYNHDGNLTRFYLTSDDINHEQMIYDVKFEYPNGIENQIYEYINPECDGDVIDTITPWYAGQAARLDRLRFLG